MLTILASVIAARLPSYRPRGAGFQLSDFLVEVIWMNPTGKEFAFDFVTGNLLSIDCHCLVPWRTRVLSPVIRLGGEFVGLTESLLNEGPLNGSLWVRSLWDGRPLKVSETEV